VIQDNKKLKQAKEEPSSNKRKGMKEKFQSKQANAKILFLMKKYLFIPPTKYSRKDETMLHNYRD